MVLQVKTTILVVRKYFQNWPPRVWLRNYFVTQKYLYWSCLPNDSSWMAATTKFVIRPKISRPSEKHIYQIISVRLGQTKYFVFETPRLAIRCTEGRLPMLPGGWGARLKPPTIQAHVNQVGVPNDRLVSLGTGVEAIWTRVLIITFLSVTSIKRRFPGNAGLSSSAKEGDDVQVMIK